MASLEHKRSRLVLLVANAASLLLTILWNALANENTLPGKWPHHVCQYQHLQVLLLYASIMTTTSTASNHVLSDTETVLDKHYLSIYSRGW